MNDFDDPELGRLLGRLAGGPPESDAAYGRLQGGIRQAKRRRTAVWSSTALATVLLGTAAFAAPWRDDGAPRISAAGPSTDDGVTATTATIPTTNTDPSAPATSAPVATSALAEPTVVPSETVVTSAPTTATGPAPTQGPSGPPATAPTGNSSSTPGVATTAPAPATTVPAATSTGAPAPASTSTTCSSPQGVGFAVTLANGVLTRGAVTANGYETSTTEARADRIEMEFVSGSVRVSVRADAEGATIQCRSEVETDDHEDSSDSSVPDGHGDESNDSDD